MAAAPQLKNALKFELEVLKGPHAGLRLGFAKTSITIGRGPENDVVLANDPRVSRQHAEIKMRGDSEFVIINTSGKNYVVVNGQNVQSELLLGSALIQIGDTEMRFHAETLSVATPPPLAAVIPAAAPLPPMPASMPSAPMPSPSPMGGYQAPPPPPPRGAPAAAGGILQNPKARFYGLIGVVVLVGWFLLSPSKKESKDANAIRTSTISMQDVAEAEKRSQELLSMKKEKYDSLQYRRAQENFIKGFRDFQQGQYARARESFQVVLNLDPDNELAKRYYHLSKIKFDELVKFN
ncbi:MAG: FHA domain-containing protein, partial [Bdellovibrio sp.]